MWYVGKSSAVRYRHGQARPGWLERFREHLLATRRRTYAQAHRERYRTWAASGDTCVHMVPFAWVRAADVYWLEGLAIRLLQPPAQQQEVRADRLRQRTRHRPWPRQRRRPTLEQEARLCLTVQIVAAPRTSSRLRPCGLDFRGLTQRLREDRGWNRKALELHVYRPGCELYLAILLAEARPRLHYQTVWQWANPVERLLKVREQARSLDNTRQQRVDANIRRFFATSRLLPTQLCRFTVPTSDKTFLARVRAAVHDLLAFSLQGTSPLLRRYFKGLLRISQGTAGHTGQQLADQIRAARRFRLQVVHDMEPAMQELCAKRFDVEKRPIPRHVPAPRGPNTSLDISRREGAELGQQSGTWTVYGVLVGPLRTQAHPGRGSTRQDRLDCRVCQTVYRRAAPCNSGQGR